MYIESEKSCEKIEERSIIVVRFSPSKSSEIIDMSLSVLKYGFTGLVTASFYN
jgi:hypothetical protein